MRLDFAPSDEGPASALALGIAGLPNIASAIYNTLPPSASFLSAGNLAREALEIASDNDLIKGKYPVGLKHLLRRGKAIQTQLNNVKRVYNTGKVIYNRYNPVRSNSGKRFSNDSLRMAYRSRRGAYVRGRGRQTPMSFKRAYRTKRGSYRANKASIIQRTPRVEVKAFYSTSTGATAATGTLVELGTIAKGTGLDQREGSVLKALALNWKCQVTPSTANSLASDYRITIFEWTQGYVSPSPFTIFEPTGSKPSMYQFSQDNIRNYRVIYDRSFTPFISGVGIPGATPAGIYYYEKIQGQNKSLNEIKCAGRRVS